LRWEPRLSEHVKGRVLDRDRRLEELAVVRQAQIAREPCGEADRIERVLGHVRLEALTDAIGLLRRPGCECSRRLQEGDDRLRVEGRTREHFVWLLVEDRETAEARGNELGEEAQQAKLCELGGDRPSFEEARAHLVDAEQTARNDKETFDVLDHLVEDAPVDDVDCALLELAHHRLRETDLVGELLLLDRSTPTDAEETLHDHRLLPLERPRRQLP